jgi:hypothetical protein
VGRLTINFHEKRKLNSNLKIDRGRRSSFIECKSCRRKYHNIVVTKALLAVTISIPTVDVPLEPREPEQLLAFSNEFFETVSHVLENQFLVNTSRTTHNRHLRSLIR